MRTRSSVFAVACLLCLSLLACSPIASPGSWSTASSVPTSDADADAALVASVCAKATWRNCVLTMTAALDLLAGKLVAVCVYGGGDGGLIVIAREEEAAVACSPGGRVVTVVRIPCGKVTLARHPYLDLDRSCQGR